MPFQVLHGTLHVSLKSDCFDGTHDMPSKLFEDLLAESDSLCAGQKAEHLGAGFCRHYRNFAGKFESRLLKVGFSLLKSMFLHHQAFMVRRPGILLTNPSPQVWVILERFSGRSGVFLSSVIIIRLYAVRMIMFVSKISQFGVQKLRELTRGQLTSLPRTRYWQGPYSRYWQSLNHRHCSSTAFEEGNQQKDKISVTFVDKDGEEKHIKVPIGMSMLEAAHENDIELEGACEGSLACSTCHVIVMDVNDYNKLEDPTDEENDMLDLAFGLTETSRLGCQVIARPELDGIRLALPVATRNFAVDGYVPKPH